MPTRGLQPRHDAVAPRIAAEVRVDESRALDQAGAHCAPGNLVRRVPLCRVAVQCHLRLGGAEPEAVAEKELGLREVFVELPGPVVQGLVDGPGQHAVADVGTSRRDSPDVAVLAQRPLDKRLREASVVREVDAPRGGEVALLGMVDALAVHGRLHEFGNDEVEVEIALPMAVGTHVDGHAVQVDGEIGAVVEIESAQEILVGLPGARVLGGDHAGDGLDQFADAQERRQVVVRIPNHALGRRGRGADVVLRATVDDDLFVDVGLVVIVVVGVFGPGETGRGSQAAGERHQPRPTTARPPWNAAG